MNGRYMRMNAILLKNIHDKIPAPKTVGYSLCLLRKFEKIYSFPILPY